MRLIAVLFAFWAAPALAQDDTITVTPLEDDGTVQEGDDGIALSPLDQLIGELVTTPLEDELEDDYLTTSTDAVEIAVVNGTAGELRVLDKLTGEVTDLSLAEGQTGSLGFLSVTLNECRYPVDNPAGDAFALVQVVDRKENTPLFAGWIMASAPALNAMDHPRYDVWALRCITS